MSKRKKVKVTVAPIGRGMNVEIQAVMIEDPYEPGKKIPAVKNVRTHPLDEEFSSGNISQDQLSAGNRFLELYEQAEIGGSKAFDYSQQKVDSSFVHRGIPIGTMEAARELKDIRVYLGHRSYNLMVCVVGNRIRLQTLAREGSGGVEWEFRKEMTYLRKSLSATLQELVSHFGIVAQGRARRVRLEVVA
jgi:hypothetical protein